MGPFQNCCLSHHAFLWNQKAICSCCYPPFVVMEQENKADSVFISYQNIWWIENKYAAGMCVLLGTFRITAIIGNAPNTINNRAIHKKL